MSEELKPCPRTEIAWRGMTHAVIENGESTDPRYLASKLMETELETWKARCLRAEARNRDKEALKSK